MSAQTRPNSRSDRRAAASVQEIKSPLSRGAYGLVAGAAHLILMRAGEAVLRRASETPLAGGEGARLVWLPEGPVGELVVEAGTRAMLVTVPGLALMRALPATPMGEGMRRTFGQPLTFALSDAPGIDPLIEGLSRERREAAVGAELAEDHYLALVLLGLWRAARADLIAHGRAPQGLAERFVNLAAQHLREHWEVGDYASAMGVSRDRLGSAVRRATGLSPRAYLHRELTREACDILANSGMPVGQVAFRLGFADPAYFTRFFTRETGISPGQYRRQAKSRGDAGDVSYAAWP